MERAFCNAAVEQGLGYTIIGAVDAEPPLELKSHFIRAMVRGSGFAAASTEWPKILLGRNASELCDCVLSGLEQTPDFDPDESVFFLYHGHPLHIPGLIRLGSALRGRSPIMLNLYHLHHYYGLHRPKRVPELRELLKSTRDLCSLANLHLRVDSRRLAEMIENDTGERIPVLPFFSPMGDEPAAPAKPGHPAERFQLVYPTWLPARDKGFDLVIDLAEKLRGKNVDIFVRENCGKVSEVCIPSEASRDGGLRLLNDFLQPGSYRELLLKSDLVLIPYAAWQFQTRTSGVVADAIQVGTPMVGTADTWIGDQIEDLGAGTTFKDGDSDAFVHAVEKALSRIDCYRETLARRRALWLRENNLDAFIRSLTALGEDRKAIGAFQRDIGVARLAWRRLRLYFLSSLEAQRGTLMLWRGLRKASGRLKLSYFGGNRYGRMLPAIEWRTHGVSEVELRLDAYDGFLLDRGGASGTIWMAVWIADGRKVFLQDVSDGKQPLAEHSLDQIEFRSSPKSRRCLRPFLRTRRQVQRARRFLGTQGTSAPTMVPLGFIRALRQLLKCGNGTLTVDIPAVRREGHVKGKVSWRCQGVSSVEVRVDGKLFLRGGTSGSASTGEWIKDGMIFELREASSSIVPKTFRMLDLVRISADPQRYPVLTAPQAWRAFLSYLPTIRKMISASIKDPAYALMAASLPVLRSARRSFGGPDGRLVVSIPTAPLEQPVSGTVEWTCEPEQEVEIRVNGLHGALLTKGRGPGAVDTGPWIKAGTSFSLLTSSQQGWPIARLLDAYRVLKDGRVQTPDVERVSEFASVSCEVARRLPCSNHFDGFIGDDEWGAILPASSGEVYLFASYSQAFLDRYGGERVVVIAHERFLEVLKLFPHAPVRGLDIQLVDSDALKSTRRVGRVLRLEYGPYDVRSLSIGRYAGVEAGFASLFLGEVEVPLTAPSIKPRVSPSLREVAMARFRELNLMEGRTIFLSPTAQSQPSAPREVWHLLARELRLRGFSLATNCGPGEGALPGTVAWGGSLAELFVAVGLGGFLISGRSGICDVCSESRARMHVLQRDLSCIIYPGVKMLTSLSANGLTDHAVYHTSPLDEASGTFVQKVLSHGDFILTEAVSASYRV